MGQTSLKMKMLEAFRYRMYYFLVIASFFFLILVIQLINIQLIQGNDYKQKSKNNMENNIPISSSRGEIYDRNFKFGERNKVLVSNKISFSVTTVPAQFKDKKEFSRTINVLCQLLDISFEQVKENIKGRNPWERMVIKEDVSFNIIVKIASHHSRFPNIDWESAPVRVYNYGNLFSHSIGYIGSISKNEYKKLRGIGYKHFHKIGKTGIEKEYDMILRGVDGYVRRIVDVRNRVEGEEIGSRPISGNNLVLTIDFDIQKSIYDAMEGIKGAAIVIRPSTGEVISIVSKPDFDPNIIISSNNALKLRELYSDKERPFLNRVIQARYPPASTFKLLTSIASLEEEKWNPNWNYTCNGKYILKGYKDKIFYCYKRHGLLDMYNAIAESCSVYFYQLGYTIGPTILLKYANYLGLGEKTGLDIPGEITGLIPSKKWKYKTFGQPWFDGDTINLSIGQGFIGVTPIAMAQLVSCIVNNGEVYKPFLVKKIFSQNNRKVIKKFTPVKIREIPLSISTIRTIKKGMRLAVRKGTCRRLKNFKIPIAGKTGTAQTHSIRHDDSSQHAWFVGFAPFTAERDKVILLVVLVEHGIAGAVSAVPIAEKIFKKLLSCGYFDI